MAISNGELAYLAGFFDGEGSIGLYQRKRGGVILKVTVGNTFFPACERYQEAFGGSVWENRVTGNRRRKWMWSVSALEAERVLRIIRPFLHEKRAQADVALEYMEWRREQPHYGLDWAPAKRFIDKLKSLKRFPQAIRRQALV